VLIVGMSVDTFPKVRDILPITWPILFLLAIIYAVVIGARRMRPDFRTPEFVRTWRR